MTAIAHVPHHQLDDVLDALGRAQIVVFVGATGTGKTLLVDELASALRRLALTPVSIDAKKTLSLVDFNAPVAEALGCTPLDLHVKPAMRRRLRIIVDNAQELVDVPWRSAFQEQWRAFLADPHVAGKVGAAFLGRPSFRDVLAGVGSPLMNGALVRRARGLTGSEIVAKAGVEGWQAEAIAKKTGGHLSLSLQLANHTHAYPDDFGAAFRSWVNAVEDVIVRVVEDHGTGGRGIVLDLMHARGPVDEMTLLRHRFGGDAAAGLECLRDLMISGLIRRAEPDEYRLGAQMLTAPGVLQKLQIPSPNVPVDAPENHAEAAALIYRLENRLREVAVAALSGRGRGWWSEHVSHAITSEAESLWLQEKDSRSAPARELHPVMYLTLGQLRSLLTHGDVWGRVTTATGLERPAFDALWRDFSLVRNKVAHNRPASSADIALLNEISQRLDV